MRIATVARKKQPPEVPRGAPVALWASHGGPRAPPVAEHDEGPAAGAPLGEDATVSVRDYGTLQDADVLALFSESGGDVLHRSRRSLDFVVFQPPPGQGPHLRSMDELRAYVSAHTL